MEVREIRAFIAVAEELNFRKASERLGMSQPPLTRLIGQLEESLKTKLFTRTTRKVELTGAGVHLLQKCRQITQLIDETEFEIRTLSQKKKGELILSLSPSAIHSNVPKLISSFRQQFPSIKVELVELPNSTLEKKLKNGSVDMAFTVNDPTLDGIRSIPVLANEIGLLMPTENPLSKKKSIRFSDLKGETLIFHNKHDHLGFQAEFHRFLLSKNIHVNIYYKKSNESCRNLTVLGKGLLITSKLFVLDDSSTVFVPFSEYYPRLKIQGLWVESNKSLALKAFLSFIEEKSSLPHSEMDYHLA